MALPVPTFTSPIRFAVLPEHCEAMLRALASESPPWDEIALLVMREPGLLHALLAASPLAHQRLATELRELLVARLRLLGTGMLRAWIAQQLWDRPAADAAARATVADSLLVAECAFHLARQTGYAYPDEAYLAGLWHQLSALCISLAPGGPARTEGVEAGFPLDRERAADRDETPRDSTSAGQTVRLAALCELPEPLIDALTLDGVLEEQIRVAHPLVRLLWSARRLARDDWGLHVERLAGINALDASELYSLRVDAGFLAKQHAPPPSSGTILPTLSTTAATSHPATSSSTPLRSPDPLRLAALAGLIQDCFADLDVAQRRGRFEAACGLLCRTAPPLVVVADDMGMLRPLALGGAGRIDECYAEFRQRADDETSVIALAVRTGMPASRFDDSAQPGRSLHDWHVSRWLGRRGFLCLPLNLRHETAGVAVVAVDGGAQPDAETRELLGALTSAAANAALETDRRKALDAQMAADVAERFRSHAHRVAHEARNPLTIIRTYLDLLSQRHPDPATLTEEMKVLHGELDRLGTLIRQSTEAPEKATEPDDCAVSQVLHDLRALYGEALFDSRGVRFELRTMQGLPKVAMPASALKQVLLNLFRNASEVLQPGGRLDVVLAGQLLSDGVPCVEIRLIDNGPGLPPERLADLFTPRPSSKDGEHRGLGLSIVRDILRQWHAHILCRSQPGTGTSFQLLVPVANSG